MKQIFKFMFLQLIIVLIIVGGESKWNVPGAAEETKQIKISWGEYAGAGDGRYVQYDYFIKRIAEETKNRIDIKMYPGEQLVKSAQIYEAVIQGTVDMSAISTAYYAGKLPLLAYQMETGYWDNGDAGVIVSRLRKEIDEIFKKDGVKFLGWGGILPPLCLVGPKTFRTFDDMKGLKFRTPGIGAAVINAWGGTGVAISNPEIYMALQRGVVDGAYATLDAWVTYHMWEVAKTITFNRCGGGPTFAIMNGKKWEGLPEYVKNAFEKVSREMPAWLYFYNRNNVESLEKFLKSKFKMSYKLTPEENKIWMEKQNGYIWKPAVKKYGEPARVLWEKWADIAKECANARETGDLPKFY